MSKIVCASRYHVGGKNTTTLSPSLLILPFFLVQCGRRGEDEEEEGGKASLLSLKSMEANDRAVVSTVGCNDHEMRSLHSHYSVPQIYKKVRRVCIMVRPILKCN